MIDENSQDPRFTNNFGFDGLLYKLYFHQMHVEPERFIKLSIFQEPKSARLATTKEFHSVFFEGMKKARLFLMDCSDFNAREIVPLADGQSFGLPFESVFLESIPGQGDLLKVFLDNEHSKWFDIGSILAVEIDFRITICALGVIRNKKNNRTEPCMTIIPENQYVPLSPPWSVYQGGLALLSRFSSKTSIAGKISLNLQAKVRNQKGDKINHRIKTAIVITNKKNQIVCEQRLQRHVIWSHCWEVMGHWRKLPEGHIGKNREGQHQVFGQTWVVPHKKGIGDLIKKTRVIYDEEINGFNQ